MVVELACQALKVGKVLELQYDGFSRCVEVHAVGTSKAGNVVMCCWQICWRQRQQRARWMETDQARGR